MKLSSQEMDALCEFVDGRRAAGAAYDAIAAELHAYTAGDDARLSENDLDTLETWHRAWSQRKVYRAKQQASGDIRGGSRIPEVAVDWEAADEGEVKLGRVAESPREISLSARAEALTVILYLKRALLSAAVKWTAYKTIVLRPGREYQVCKGAGKMALAGAEVEWLRGAVILRNEGTLEAIYAECRIRRIRPKGWMGTRHPSLQIERLEVDGKQIDLRDVSARLAAVVQNYLGPAGSSIRNNAELAELLGVTREAIRVRRQRIMKEAGSRSTEGLQPNRARGGQATQRRKRQQQ